MNTKITLAASLLLSTASVSQSGPVWEERLPLTTPGGAARHVMTHHSGTGKSYLYGGMNTNDTWEWDGCRWTLLSPPNSPSYAFCANPPYTSRREGMAATYDSNRGVTSIYGGCIQCPGVICANTDEIWEFDGTTWTQVVIPMGPGARIHHRWAYDPVAQVTVMFGGFGAPADTWIYDGVAGTWTLVPPSPLGGPRPTELHSMAYSPIHGGVVMFGGLDHSGSSTVAHSDFWVFSSATMEWTPVVQIAGLPSYPEAREGSAMCYHPGRQSLILAGGSQGNTNYDDVWEWRVDRWEEITPYANNPAWQDSHSPRGTHQTLIYDDTRQEMIAYGGGGGGFDEVWVLPSEAVSRSCRQLGPGTVAAHGQVECRFDQCPQAGMPLAMTISNLPAVPAGVVFGFVSLGTTPTYPPMTGQIHLDATVAYLAHTLPYTQPNTSISTTLAIPNIPGPIYYQAVGDFGGNVIYTNSVAMNIN